MRAVTNAACPPCLLQGSMSRVQPSCNMQPGQWVLMMRASHLIWHSPPRQTMFLVSCFQAVTPAIESSRRLRNCSPWFNSLVYLTCPFLLSFSLLLSFLSNFLPVEICQPCHPLTPWGPKDMATLVLVLHATCTSGHKNTIKNEKQKVKRYVLSI